MRTIRNTSLALLVLGMAVGFSSGAQSLGAQEAERYSLHGDRPAVFNLAGNVEIVAGDGPAVEIEVTRRGPDARRLQVRTGQVDGRATLRVVYPDDEIGYPRMGDDRTSLRVRDDGTFGEGYGGGDRVRIEDEGDLEAHADLRIEVPRGSRLAVHLGVGTMEARSLRGDLTLDLASGEITTRDTRGSLSLDAGAGRIQVNRARGDLTADTGSGDIRVRDVDGGTLDLDTGSGSVEMNSVQGTSLRVDTGSGSIRGTGVEADELEVDTGSGAIRLDGVTTARATLDTGSGGVRLGLTSDMDELTVDTGSGNVTVTVPSDFGARLDLDSGSGSVRVRLPVTGLESGRTHLRGTVGDGEGTVEIDTGSGNIQIGTAG